MDLSRRQFMVLGAVAAAGWSLRGSAFGGTPDGGDAGAIGDFAKDGVYDFRDRGFFLIRKGRRLVAQTAYCTHKQARIVQDGDGSFTCKKHGSHFSQDGKVTRGPARSDLPRNGISRDDRGHVLVDTSVVFKPGDFEKPGAFIDVA